MFHFTLVKHICILHNLVFLFVKVGRVKPFRCYLYYKENIIIRFTFSSSTQRLNVLGQTTNENREKKTDEGETTNQFFLFLKICFELKKKITTKLGWVGG